MWYIIKNGLNIYIYCKCTTCNIKKKIPIVKRSSYTGFPTRKCRQVLTSWYFLVTFVGIHWHSLQFWWQQAQFPPQRLTRRHSGQKMVSVRFSSSLSDTEKLRGVQLYSRTSSFSKLRSTTAKRQMERSLFRSPHQLFCNSGGVSSN